MQRYEPLRMQDKRPDNMSDETFEHYKLVREYPLYWETRCWFPVLIGKDKNETRALEWLSRRGKRGTRETRNDWLHPRGKLVLIREDSLAIEFKLKWG